MADDGEAASSSAELEARAAADGALFRTLVAGRGDEIGVRRVHLNPRPGPPASDCSYAHAHSTYGRSILSVLRPPG